MRWYFFTLTLAAIVCLSSAAYLPGRSSSDNPPFEDRAADVCKSVKVIITLLKAHKAMPFCSSFLGITTKTITKTTGTTTTTSVETQVTTIPTTTTTTWTTFSLSTTVYKVIATSTTTLRTTTVPTTVTSTTTFSPTGTLTVTTYYTPEPYVAKRSAIIGDLEERGQPNIIPPYLKPYASSSISEGCKCLSLPTPSTTIRTAATSTTVTTTVTSTTTTETVSAFVRDISATTIPYTFLIPYVDTSFSTTTETTTTTTPPYATTTTVRVSLPTECVNIVAGGKLYNTLIQGTSFHNMVGYDIVATPGEELRSLCCADCYNKTDCMYWRVVATTFCRLYSRIEQAEGSEPSAQCPLGKGTEVLQDPVFNVQLDDPAFGKGPCL